MRQTPVNDYLKEISTELPEEIYGCLSDAIYETTCEFDEEVGLLKAENNKLSTQLTDVTESMGRVEERCAKLRELVSSVWELFLKHGSVHPCDLPEVDAVRDEMCELGINVDKLADHDFAHDENSDGTELEFADKLRMLGIEVDKWTA